MSESTVYYCSIKNLCKSSSTQCIFLAKQLEKERGGKWKYHFIEEPNGEGLGHCSFERIKD